MNKLLLLLPLILFLSACSQQTTRGIQIPYNNVNSHINPYSLEALDARYQQGRGH